MMKTQSNSQKDKQCRKQREKDRSTNDDEIQRVIDRKTNDDENSGQTKIQID